MSTDNAATTDARMAEIATLIRAGRIVDARAAARGAIDAGVASDELLAVAGMLAWRSGDAAGAVPPLRALHARRPDDRATRLNLAAALTETGVFDEIERLLAPLAGDVGVDRLRAFAAQQTGDHALAVTLYRTVLALHPDDIDSWNNLGNVHAAHGAVNEAIDAFERAITLRPDDARIYLNLAGVLERADRRAARRTTMRDAAVRQPDDPEVQLALGLAEAADGNMDAAETALARAIDLAPDAAGAYLELGLLLENRNRLDALEALAARARARIGPEAALLTGWSAFRAKRFDEAAAVARDIPATINPIRRLHLLAEIADRRGAALEAFALYEQMNAAAVAAAPPPPPGPSYRERVERAAAAFEREPLPLPPTGAAVEEGPTPIFIVGFPRSGTTLIDTLLGDLPDTFVLEERPVIAAVEARIPPETTPSALSESAAADLRHHYFDVLRTIEPEFVQSRLIDKHPLHMARMPLLNRLFPGAPVLFVERHPYDVVLSTFMANFQLNHAMTSFTSIEEAARTYDAVFTAWTIAEDRLPLNVYRVRYERLIADRNAELAGVLGFLGVSADPGALDNQNAVKVRGHIRTASYSQVTEPIYTRSVDRWRRYADQLAPVLSILRPWAERMGYPG